MANDRFMAAIQQEAAGMTAKQAEQVQVLLYAMEDFSFADFIHLAVYHKRDIFAPCPVGVTPRTWNSNSLHPALTTPPQQLSEQHNAPGRGRPRHSGASRQSPVGAELAHVDTGDSETAKLDAEEERLRKIEIPEMQKWAKLLQSGGLSRHAPTKHAPLGMATLARLKHRAATARRKLTLPLPPKLPAAGRQVSCELSGKELVLEACRPKDAVLQSWRDKVFPGEAVGFESACGNTFTGLQGRGPYPRASSSLALAVNSNPRLPPLPYLDAGASPGQIQAARAAVAKHQGSGDVPSALPVPNPEEMEVFSAAAAGGVCSSSGDFKADLLESGGKVVACDALLIPSAATNTSTPHAHDPDMLLGTPNSRRLSLSSMEAEAVAGLSDGSADLLHGTARLGGDEQEQSSVSASESSEQAEEGHHLESPGRFAAAQLLFLQQRQQQLQAHRLAALQQAGKPVRLSAAGQLVKQPVQQQTSGFDASLQPVWLRETSTMFEQGAKHAQRAAVRAEVEAVASSPLVLFSPGGPYCAQRKWYMPADMQTLDKQMHLQSIKGLLVFGLALATMGW
ncbi:hypothetical protein ABBQ32_008493 [Trebouxia sp. C0010 RCD-2024]